MKNIFEREHDKSYDLEYLPKMKSRFNESNLSMISKRKILNYFHFGEDKNFLAYRFDVLRNWIKNNERYTKEYVEELDNVINKLSLDNELNSFEKQYYMDVNAIVFAKWRNLKQLIVDFAIKPKEFVFYHYEIDSFNEIKKEQESIIFSNCDFYITTQRIVISKQIDIISISYDQIKNYSLRREKISFVLNNDKTYCIKCENTYMIYVSLERVLKREKIVFNK